MTKQEFAARVVANGKAVVDLLDEDINKGIAQRDAVLQQGAQLGLLYKLHERFQQLSKETTKESVLNIIEGEIIAVADMNGVGGLIEARLSEDEADPPKQQ